jgi:hypothetical protein
MRTQSKRRFLLKLLAGTIVVLGAVAGGLFGYFKWKYPYGMSHCCSKGMGLALRTYAMDHNGRFPAGGQTPEASLSLLYSNYVHVYWLKGKTVSLEAAETALAKDGKLGPESCDWHYVEGLIEADDPEIAILWDKVGLGHNGQRMKGGGHEVVLVDGSSQYVSGAKWPEFLARQQQLLAQRSEAAKKALPALTAKIRLPDGTELSQYDGKYTLFRGSGSESGRRLELRWMRFHESDGPCTLTLELPEKRLRSKPVTVEVSSGRATPDAVVFEMETY